MPDTGAPWFIPYVEDTDLVSDFPTDSLALANAIDAGLDAALTAGIGSNVVQTVKTDTFTTTSTSFTDVTGLTATITPSSNTAKILVIAQVNWTNLATVNLTGYFLRLNGGGADTYVGDAASNRVRAAAYNFQNDGSFQMSNAQQASTLVFLSSPATAAAVTYAVQARTATSGSVIVNRNGSDTDSVQFGRTASSIAVIEVAA